MEEKKLKFELSKVTLIFVILFGLCVLIWTFILGVWIGTKIGGKTETAELPVENKTDLKVSALPQNKGNESANHTQSTNVSISNFTENQTLPSPEQPKGATQALVPKEEKVKTETVKKEVTIKKEEVKRETEKKVESPQYKEKQVANLATKLKEESSDKFALQVGAFSVKEKAVQLKERAQKLGYFSQIKEVISDGKTLYKVFVGKYETREEAERAITEIKNKLGVDKPFVVELKQ